MELISPYFIIMVKSHILPSNTTNESLVVFTTASGEADMMTTKHLSFSLTLHGIISRRFRLLIPWTLSLSFQTYTLANKPNFCGKFRNCSPKHITFQGLHKIKINIKQKPFRYMSITKIKVQRETTFSTLSQQNYPLIHLRLLATGETFFSGLNFSNDEWLR